MATKEKRQEEFAPKECKIITERYIITVFYYGKKSQSVTVYKKDGEVAKYKFHCTYSIDINEELEPYSFYTNNEETENGILEITSFLHYITSIVYDAIKWLECWKEVEMNEEQETVSRISYQLMSSITDETTE